MKPGIDEMQPEEQEQQLSLGPDSQFYCKTHKMYHFKYIYSSEGVAERCEFSLNQD